MKKGKIFTIVSTFAIAATISSCGSASNETEGEANAVTEEVTEQPAEESAAVSGEELFTSSGCVACHQVETKTVGPSIKEIAGAYSDNGDGLKSFLNGEGEAIVDPTQEAIMAPQVETTKAMSETDRNAVADYIMNI